MNSATDTRTKIEELLEDMFSVRSGLRLYKKERSTEPEVIQNHDNENVRTIGQGEARHRKYKRLKLGGG
jgi:hypothetical protein